MVRRFGGFCGGGDFFTGTAFGSGLYNLPLHLSPAFAASAPATRSIHDCWRLSLQGLTQTRQPAVHCLLRAVHRRMQDVLTLGKPIVTVHRVHLRNQKAVVESRLHALVEMTQGAGTIGRSAHAATPKKILCSLPTLTLQLIAIDTARASSHLSKCTFEGAIAFRIQTCTPVQGRSGLAVQFTNHWDVANTSYGGHPGWSAALVAGPCLGGITERRKFGDRSKRGRE